MGGVALGDSMYIAAYMDEETQATMSTIKTRLDKLRDLCMLSLYPVTLHSVAPKVLHHVQHVLREDGRQTIRQAVAACVGDAGVAEDAVRALLILPARM